MTTDNAQNADLGDFQLHNFALVNETNAAQILQNHKGSQDLISRDNKISFKSGRMPSNLIQAQRDYFGAHTYELIGKEGTFHTQWFAK